VIEVRLPAVRFEAPAQVRLLGKGRKERLCPLWPETIALVRAMLTDRGVLLTDDVPLFVNANGHALTRFGLRHIVHKRVGWATVSRSTLAKTRITPHTFRHYLPSLLCLVPRCRARFHSTYSRQCRHSLDSLLTPCRGERSHVKCVINDQVVLSRSPEGPIAAHIRAFGASQTALGYARGSLQREIRLAAGFSQWLKQEGVGLQRVDADQVSRYLRVRRRQVLPNAGDRAALRHLLQFLRREGVIAAEPIAAPRLTPAERSVHAYVEYLRDARALASATITNYAPFIQGFLTDRFGDGSIRLARLTARDVVRFVQRQAPRLHLKRAKLLTSALRSFLQYARYEGAVTLDLAAAVPAVANWSMPAIPRAINPMLPKSPTFGDAFITGIHASKADFD